METRRKKTILNLLGWLVIFGIILLLTAICCIDIDEHFSRRLAEWEREFGLDF